MAVRKVKRRWSPERRAAFERSRITSTGDPVPSLLAEQAPVPPPKIEFFATPSGHSPIRIIVVWRRALATPPEEAEVDWPAGWRLPVAGESVLLANGSGGMIETIQWDLGRRAIRLNIR